MFKNYILLFQCILLICIGAVLSFFLNEINYERIIVIMNFIVILSGFILPINYSVACGIITPVVCTVWFGHPEIYPQLILTICLMVAYTSFANIFYDSANMKIYPALFSTLIMGNLVLFSAASILAWVTDSFNAISYFAQFFTETMPGTIFQLAFIPLIIKIYEHIKNRNDLQTI